MQIFAKAWTNFRKNATAEKYGETLVANLDTMLLMGLISEYKDGRNWIERNLSTPQVQNSKEFSQVLVFFFKFTNNINEFTVDCYRCKADYFDSSRWIVVLLLDDE